MRILSSLLSLSAQRNLSVTTKALARSMERLASGKRVNSARDDAAGLAIASGLESQMRSIAIGILNINESAAQTQTLSGELDSIRSTVQRMRELALQSANGILSSSDRVALNAEFLALQDEITRTIEQGSWSIQNGRGPVAIQIGENRNDKINFETQSLAIRDLFGQTSEEIRGLGTYSIASTVGIGAAYSQQAGAYSDDDVNDLAITVSSLNQVKVFVNNGSGVMSQTATISGVAGSTFTTSRDFTGDGIRDILVTHATNGTIQLYANNGDGTFQLTTNQTVAAFSSVNINYDLNDDDGFDIIVQRTTSADTYLVNSSGTATLSSSISHGLTSAQITSGEDFNGDGIDDLYVRTNGSGGSAYLNNGSGVYSLYGAITIAANFIPLIDDLNGDGFDDIYSYNTTTGVLNTYLNNGLGVFSPTATISGAASSYFTGYFNSDGRMDFAQENAGILNVYLDNGSGSYSLAATHSLGGAILTTSADINDDGLTDFFSISSSGVAAFLAQGNGRFNTSYSYSHSFGGSSVSWELDGDSPYLSVANTTTGEAIYHSYVGDGVFQVAKTFNLGGAMQSMTFTDLDGDGDQDLSAYNSTTVYNYFQEANGNFSARPNYSASISGSGLSRSDFNGDGISDFTTRDASNNISVHLQNTSTVTSIDESLLSIATQSEAEDVLDILDDAMDAISSRSAELGALQSRLEFAVNSSFITKENLAAARSQIMDADYAEETANLVRDQILQAAGLNTFSAVIKNWKIGLDLLKIL